MPIYQTASDVANEREVAKVVGAALRADMVEFPAVTSAADWLATQNGQAVALIEIKCRKNARCAYNTYYVDKQKVEKVASLASELGVKGFLAVKFTDCICLIDAKNDPAFLQEAVDGRMDRNDPNDIDIVYHYDSRKIRKIFDLR